MKVRHKKRGTVYEVIGYGQIQTDTPLADYAEVAVYQEKGGDKIWIRPLSEFQDGRFEVLTPETTAKTAPAWKRMQWLDSAGIWHDHDSEDDYSDRANWNVTMREKPESFV